MQHSIRTRTLTAISGIFIMLLLNVVNAAPVPVCFGKSHFSASVCSYRGICVATNTCDCSISPGYHGDQCEKHECYGVAHNATNVCSGHGDCASPDWCTCDYGYTGKYCEVERQCYGKSIFDPNACNGGGSCGEDGKCICTNGSTDQQCFTEFSCNGVAREAPWVCGGESRGNCTAKDTCQCKPGYSGTTCENWSCFGLANNNTNVCSGNGFCVAPDACGCKEGFTGRICDATETPTPTPTPTVGSRRLELPQVLNDMYNSVMAPKSASSKTMGSLILPVIILLAYL